MGMPPLTHVPISPRVNSARSEGPDLIEPAAQLGVFIQAGIVWGQLLNKVHALDLKINNLEALFDRILDHRQLQRQPEKAGILKKNKGSGFFYVRGYPVGIRNSGARMGHPKRCSPKPPQCRVEDDTA